MIANIVLTALIGFAGLQSDTYSTQNGGQLSFVFLGHASAAVLYEEKVIYIDPVGGTIDYSKLPDADVVLITHHHGDHLDKESIAEVTKEGTVIYASPEAAAMLDEAQIMRNGDKCNVEDWLAIEAVAAYNTTEGREGFHPRGRDNGYILTVDGKRIYFSGDSEPTPEMSRIQNIDYLFLAVNQPYTMTPAQAADVVNRLRPEVFYPYHYGQTDEKTDLKRLARLIMENATKMKIRNME